MVANPTLLFPHRAGEPRVATSGKLLAVEHVTYIPQVEETIWREFRCESGGRNARGRPPGSLSDCLCKSVGGMRQHQMSLNI
jgi:hypothetical protein